MFIFSILIGLVVGSFLNCLLWRLHTEESLWGRSYCPLCRGQIAWHDNFPVLSFLLLGGRCRHCRGKISWQYPAVEIITAILFLLAWQQYAGFFSTGWDWSGFLFLFRDWFLIAVMIVVFVYDLKWYLILDVITLPAIIVVTVLNLALGFYWGDLVMAGALGVVFFLLQFLLSKGKWIGGGDIRLGLLMGLGLGNVWLLLTALFLAYIIGSVVGLSLLIAGKKKWGSQVPLGVFLALGAIITIFWGSNLLDWYLGLLMR